MKTMVFSVAYNTLNGASKHENVFIDSTTENKAIKSVITQFNDEGKTVIGINLIASCIHEKILKVF